MRRKISVTRDVEGGETDSGGKEVHVCSCTHRHMYASLHSRPTRSETQGHTLLFFQHASMHTAGTDVCVLTQGHALCTCLSRAEMWARASTQGCLLCVRCGGDENEGDTSLPPGADSLVGSGAKETDHACGVTCAVTKCTQRSTFQDPLGITCCSHCLQPFLYRRVGKGWSKASVLYLSSLSWALWGDPSHHTHLLPNLPSPHQIPAIASSLSLPNCENTNAFVDISKLES